MSNNTNGCHYMLFLLGFMAVSLSLFFATFTLVLTNENNHMLTDATVEHVGTKQRTFRAACCDFGTCGKEKTLWQTVVMPAPTVTETATIYVSGHDTPTRPATAEMEDAQPTTLVPQVLPTGDVHEPDKKKFFIRGVRDGHIVDVNKPEMQM